jgi:hypothetical protein
MSPSSDIETLFGHFGGNASGYQEIGRENEASTARTRWPLLVTLDLKQTPIPAIAQQRERAAFLQAPATDAAGAAHGEHGAATEPAAGAAEADATSTTALRSKAPLFTRPHRRNVPPVASVVKTDSPRGGDRFGAVPEVSGTAAVAPEGQSAAAQVAAVPVAAPAVPPMVPPVIPPVVPGVVMQSRVPPVAPPAAQPALQPAVPPVVQAAQPAPVTAPMPGAARSFMQAASPAAIPPVLSRPAAFAAPQARTFATGAVPPAVPVSPVVPAAPVAPTSPFARPTAATQPPSILGRLFASAAPQAAPAAQPHTVAAQPADLRSVFDRLRGAPRNTAAPAPAPHSWLTNGPRRS